MSKKDFESNELDLRNYEKIVLTLKRLESAFGDRILCEITTDEIRDWIRGLRLRGGEDAALLAGKTRNVIRGYVRLIFNRAIDMHLTKTNPVLGIKKFREHYNETEEIGVITADQAETLLRTVDPEAIPFLAVWLFTGIRRATIEKMDWSQIPITGRRIKVPRYIGKNRRNRRPYPVEVDWIWAGVEEFPNIDTVQKYMTALYELNWSRYCEASSVLGTKAPP